MAKGWTKIKTINDYPTDERSAGDRRNHTRYKENMIRNTKTLDVESLKKESKNLYNERLAKEDFLIAGYEEKRLLSKKAIKEAIKIKKNREKTQSDKNVEIEE